MMLIIVLFSLLINSHCISQIKKENSKIINYSKRNLDEEPLDPSMPNFIQLNIYFDLNNFNDNFPITLNQADKDNIILAMNKAKETLEKFITIDSRFPNYNFPEGILEDNCGIDSWDTVMFPQNEISKMSDNGNNYFIFFRFESLDSSIPAKSKICLLHVIEDVYAIPIMGVITLNSNLSGYQLKLDYLKALMLHHFTHLLGFHTKFELYDTSGEINIFDGIIKENDEKTKYYIDNLSAPNTIKYANEYFGIDVDIDSSIISEIELELDNNGEIHWPSKLLLGEYMTEFTYPEEQVISKFTLEFLNDLNYIKVNKYYTGGLMRFGKNKGYSFYNKNCLSEGLKFENEFYYPEEGVNLDETEPSCSSGRLSRTVHKLTEYDIPNNFCIISKYDSYNPSNVYINSCSRKGTISEDEKNIYGEAISDNSFCALNTLVINRESSSSQIKAGCYNMFCSPSSLTIQVGEDFLVCPRAGGKIISKNYSGYILCPDYNLICTVVDSLESNEDGKLCNDMFDCVKKGIEEKPIDIKYNYISKTTQLSSEYTVQVDEEGWEETEIGICPINCAQCKENRGCIKCKNLYGLIGTNEDLNNEKINCEELTILNANPYYSNSESIYYPCSYAECTTCENKNTCTGCIPNYKLVNGKCEEKIANCISYDDEACLSCKDGFGLVKEDAQTSCIESDNLINYYYSITEGDSTYYKKCSSGVSNCNKCTSSTYCTECINNGNDKQFAILNDNHGECKDLSNNEYYYDTSDSKYKECKVGLDKCKKCKKDDIGLLNCLNCEEPYKLVHSDVDKCIPEAQIENNYFTDEEGNHFSCTDYHSVENCKTCNTKDNCLSCKNGYQLLGSNNICISNSDLKKNKYVLINNSYKACSEVIKGCEKCSNEGESIESIQCIECNIAYDLDIYNKCIPTALALIRYFKDPITGKYKSCSESINNCEECISETECTRCNSGYELVNHSECKRIIKETEESNDIKENNESKDNNQIVNNSGKDKDYDKIKGLATGGIVLGSLGTVAAIVAFIFIFLKNILFKNTVAPNPVIDATNSANIVNEQPNEVVVQSTRRSIHNEQKNNEDENKE